MAVPKLNYTQTPNIYIDEYMHRMSPQATMVFLAICRQTIGWHKDTDKISLSQLMAKTGLSKNSVIKGIKELESANLVIVCRSGQGRNSKNWYEINFENDAFNGSRDEHLEDESEKNGSRDEPIKPLKGSRDEPIKPVNGSRDEHTKEIVLNKDIKETQSVPDGPSVHQQIKMIFEKGSESLSGQTYYHDGKEAKQIKLLEQRYENDPEAFINLTRKYYYMITTVEDNFWDRQPFTPSAFNSLYNRILSFQLPENSRKKIVQQQKTDEQILLERWGRYDDRKLDFLQKQGSLTPEQVEYIKQNRPLEVSA